MKLKELLKGIRVKKITGPIELDVKGITINSREKIPSTVFVSIAGLKKDGHDFAEEAIKNGSVAVFVQKVLDLPDCIPQIVVDNCREVLPILCRNFYRYPSGYFELVGVTGTNGKTTTCFLINSILNSAGLKTSIITTVQSAIDDKLMKFDRTTPESIDLNRFFDKSRSENIDSACMEVSSHSVDLHRVDYLKFDYFVFTNLSQDHLDYHKNMERYFSVKKKLFLKENRDIYGGKCAIINIDDSYGVNIKKCTDLNVISFSLKDRKADIIASNIKNSLSGIEMNINYYKDQQIKIYSPLCGYFNIYNILAAIGVCIGMGIEIGYIKEGIKKMSGVKGRFEKIDLDKNIRVIVDYAHTPDGLENVLKTARTLLQSGNKLISVFGCGGDRDRFKRKVMGRISSEFADFTIITSDNPRTEDPRTIISMIEKGFAGKQSKKYIKEIDRKKAIVTALDMAEENDIVLIAGKGHEDYQDFKDRRIHFSDQEVVRQWGNK